MNSLDAVGALLDADRWLERVVAQRDHLPELAELASLEAELRSRLQELAQLDAEGGPVRRRYEECRTESTTLTTKVRDVTHALETSTAGAKELAMSQRQLEQLRERLSAVEDEELAALEILEPLEEAIATLKSSSAPLVARRQELLGTIAALQSSLDEEISALRTSRDACYAALAPSWQQRYDRAGQRVAGIGAARLIEGRCDGCRIALAPLERDRLSQLPIGECGECPECGRLLLA